MQQQRELRQLYRLNDHLLRDIGLTTGDLHAVSEGQVTFEQLNAQRQATQAAEGNQAAEGKTLSLNQSLHAANQERFNQAA